MEDQQGRYERARARVQAIKGFYIHASVFVVINIGLFLSMRLRAGSRAGYGGFTGRSRLGHRLGSTRPWRLWLRWGRPLGPRLGGTQD